MIQGRVHWISDAADNGGMMEECRYCQSFWADSQWLQDQRRSRPLRPAAGSAILSPLQRDNS
jgi:hypothetical protein